MTQQAIVKSLLPNKFAEITVRRKTACGSDCANCHGCAHPQETMSVTAYNAAGAKEGDSVTVESSSGQIIGLAALVYIMPVILMIIGYMAVPGGEGGKIAASIAGLLAGLTVCIFVSRQMKKSGKMTFVITKIDSLPGDIFAEN